MRHASMIALATVVAATALPAAAGVEVSYKNPEKFSDASPDLPSRVPNPRVLDGLQQELTELGIRYLRPEQTLKIEISDIDLAGEFEPTPLDRTQRIRVLRDATWPRIKLHYAFYDGDQLRAEGDEQLKDLNYLNDSTSGAPNDSLRYEKALIDRWFKANFVNAAATTADPVTPAAAQ